MTTIELQDENKKLKKALKKVIELNSQMCEKLDSMVNEKGQHCYLWQHMEKIQKSHDTAIAALGI